MTVSTRQPHDSVMIEKARELWEDPGSLEIGRPEDSRGMVSHAPQLRGAWVRAWVWVDLHNEIEGGGP